MRVKEKTYYDVCWIAKVVFSFLTQFSVNKVKTKNESIIKNPHIYRIVLK